MSRALERYLDCVMIYANRKKEDAAKIRDELKDHLLKKIDALEAEGLSHEEAVLQALKEHGHSRIVGFGLRERFTRTKVYVLTAFILLIMDYVLLLGRFYWFGFGTASTWVYKFINFPCSFLYLWLEKRPNQWWYGIFGHQFEYIFNDEIGILLAAIILTLLQVLLVTALLLRFKRRRQDIEVSGV